ncbi:MAG: indole-3-glycerol phosphate synthase TrpC [Dehalococcoidales bacterium]|nr:MAG: indole-3-glycerol phosphate synthase TrpC [Dehalococcoidales bacterium]
MILDDIIADKIPEVEKRKHEQPLEDLEKRIQEQSPALDFASALKGDRIKLIAEVKKASPSKGVIREDFNPVEIAGTYSRNGAAAISVLTDEKYFMGSLDYLKDIRKSLDIPVPLLRKDFILDEYQVYEARAAGADAMLLIVAALEPEKLAGLLKLSHQLSMKCLVETHNEYECEVAVNSGAEIIGINNRDLKTFDVDIETTGRLRQLIPPDRIVVSESGIKNRDDIERLKSWNIDAVLIGESLMASADIAAAMKEFL